MLLHDFIGFEDLEDSRPKNEHQFFPKLTGGGSGRLCNRNDFHGLPPLKLCKLLEDHTHQVPWHCMYPCQLGDRLSTSTICHVPKQLIGRQ